MAGGLMQLVAYGAQDIYLTGNPQITFFKVVYRRHTNFSLESVKQTFHGQANPGVTPGPRGTCVVNRSGDLIHKIYVNSSSAGITNGNALVDEVELQIGGTTVDRHYREWNEIWTELSTPESKAIPYRAMTGTLGTSGANATGVNLVQVPLNFWFNRNPGLALPLIALQYHEVKFNFQFAAATALSKTTAEPPTVNSIKMYVDYIYLDTEERRRFAQQSHEYLIDQVQYTGAVAKSGAATTTQSLRLDFNHPCKELVWVCRVSNSHQTAFAEQSDSAKPGSALLQLNGHDRFAKRPMNYFTRMQTMQHHTNVPAGDRIACYSFGLRPEDHQPSGTCNFSRIDNATLQLKDDVNAAANHEYQVYATNYNVLRIMSGMGGLAYSN